MTKLSNLTISTKLVFGFGVMVLISIMIGLGGFRNIHTIKKNMERIIHVHIPSMDYLIETDRDYYQLLVAERSMIFANPQSPLFDELVKDYESNLSQAEERWKKFKSVNSNRSDQFNALISDFDHARDKWLELSRQIVDGRKADTREGHRLALDLSLNQAKESFDTMRNNLDELTKLTLRQSSRAYEETELTVKHAVTVMVFLIGLGVIAGVGLAFILQKAITRPLNAAINGLKDIAQGEGDLTLRLVVSSTDEVGELSRWFNTFIEKLQRIIKNIGLTSAQLGKTAGQLSDLSSRMAGQSVSMNDKTVKVAVSAENITESFASISSSVEESAGNTQNVVDATEQLSSSINDISDNTEKASHVTQDASQQSSKTSYKMKALGEAAQAISGVTEAITEISEQTNLLALNATIEAARAGEAGKGFAVVANEIKALANQTAEATAEIKQKISDIQVSTQETVTEMDHIATIIAQANESVSLIATALDEQTSVTQGISESSNFMAKGINSIKASVTRSSQAAEAIAGEIGDITDSIGSISEDSSVVADNSKHLAALSEKLNDLVNQFKV